MKILVRSFNMINGLDDDYTLYENGDVIHSYDENQYPGGYNLEKRMHFSQLPDNIKQRILEDSSEENKKVVKSMF